MKKRRGAVAKPPSPDPVAEALRRQALIVEHLYDGIIVSDPAGKILEWNPAAERMFGYGRAEVIGRSAELLNRPGEAPAITRAIQEGMRTQGQWSGELRLMAKDGSEREVEAIVIALRDGRGRTIGRVAVNRDVTEQRRAERIRSATFQISEAANAAENLQELYRAIHNIVGELMPAKNLYIALYDPATELISFPYFVDEHDVAGAPKRLGRGLTEYVLRTGRPLLATPERTRELERLGEIELLGTPSLDWLGVPLKVGDHSLGVLAVQSYSPGVRYGEPERRILQFVSTQVAMAIERKRADEEDERRQAFLRQVIDLNPNLIFVKDWEGRFTLVNRALADLYGARPDDLIGRRDADFNPNPDEVEQYLRDDREVMTSGQPRFNMEEPNTDVQTGDRRWFQVIKVPLRTPEGAPQVLGVATEITQRKLLEGQLRQAQKMEAVGQLAGGIAHDFNNVLTAILGYTRLLLKDPTELPARQRADVEEIREAAQRAATLTQQLLAFSRKQVLQLVVLDVNEVVQGMRSLLRRLIGEHITLVATLDHEPLPVRADHGQLQQVIINLSVNARDAMPAGGRLTIATCRAELDAAFVRAHPGSHPGSFARLEVVDTGMGMDAETRRRVFEPFFTTKAAGKGSGLGLATVYGIVKQSGGYIAVASESQRGSAFTVYLPLVAGAAAAPPLEAAGTPGRGRETVLLVEDETGVRALARRALQSFGYRVLEAENGQAALAVARQCREPIDLLLTDIVMPEMGGRELAEVLKRERPGTRVLYTSGYPDAVGLQQEVQEATASYLPKPYTPEDLARKVREVLDAPAEGAARSTR